MLLSNLRTISSGSPWINITTMLSCRSAAIQSSVISPNADETVEWSKIIVILMNHERFISYNLYKLVLTNTIRKIHIYHYYYIKYMLSACISTLRVNKMPNAFILESLAQMLISVKKGYGILLPFPILKIIGRRERIAISLV